jgi:amino acid adenylation domain-containing protein
VLVLDELTLDESVSDVAGPALSDALYCIYTSGSTGTPKGVQLSQRGLANLLQWQMTHERLSRPAKTLQFASFSFDVSFQELFSTWCTGGELVMISEDQRQDLSALAGFIAEQNIERVYLPFAALQPLAESWEHSSTDLSLTDIVVAGEQLKVTPAVRSLFTRLDKAALHNQYGPSETHVVTALTLTGDANNWPTLPSIGTPVANTRCYALDEQQQPVPIGLPGELYLGGAQIALGYLNRPELDQDKFIASPFVAGDRLYRSGDRVRFKANGQIEFLGRVDDQVKWRGFRIEPGEIEAALTGQDSVEDAVIIIREDTGDARLVAYVTPGSSTPDTQQLAQALKASLPDYMQPSIIVVLDDMPLTPSGKVARRALPVPDYASIQTAPFVAPRTPTEEALVSLWQQVLTLERVSVHDDFFQLGGHSLLATQLIARVRDAFAMRLPLKYVFRYPSPEELAGAIDTIKASQTIQQPEPNSDHEELRI